MLFRDALGVFEFDYPLGWLPAPTECTLTRTVLDAWAGGHGRLEVMRFDSSTTPEDWPQRWLMSAGSRLCALGVPAATNLRLEPGGTRAVASSDEGMTPQRVLVTRGNGAADVAVIETGPGSGLPGTSIAMRQIAASFRWLDQPPSHPETIRLLSVSPGAAMARDVCARLYRACATVPTPLIAELTRGYAELALTGWNPLLLVRAVQLLQQQLADTGTSAGELPDLRQELARAEAGFAELATMMDPGLAATVSVDPGDPSLLTPYQLRGDLLLAEGRLELDRTGPSAAADATAQALVAYLMAGQQEGDLQVALGRVLPPPFHMPDAAEPTGHGWSGSEPTEYTLLKIAYAAGVCADLYDNVGRSAAARETDAVAVAGLRRLHRQRTDRGLAPALADRLYKAAQRSLHGPPDEARSLYEEALALPLSEAEAEDLDEIRHRVGASLARTPGDYARDDPDGHGPVALAQHAAALFLDGKPDAAAVWAARAEQALEDLVQAATDDQQTALGAIGLTAVYEELGDRERATRMLGIAAQHAARCGAFSELCLQVLDGGRLFKSSDPDTAYLSALAAVGVQEVMRLSEPIGENRIRASDAEHLADRYDRLIGQLLMEGQLAAALVFVDRARGRGTVDQLTAEERGFHVPLTPVGVPADAQPQQALRSLIEGVLAQTDEVLRQAGVTGPMPAEFVTPFIRDVGSNMLVVHQLGTSTIALFAADPHGRIRVVPSPTSADMVNQLASTVRETMRIHSVTRGIETPDGAATGTVTGQLQELYAALVAPVRKHFDPAAPLIVVPYRELGLLPWALLCDSSGRALLDSHPVSITPSLSVLSALRTRSPRFGPGVRAYVAADPVLGPRQRLRGLGALPAARSEADHLERLLAALPPWHGPHVIRVGADATETSYRREAAGATLIHLACHAELAEPAENSRMHLAPDAQGDGQLTAAEVPATQLRDAVVFLAACDTGQGRLSADGVLGLGEAFLRAGARAVVLSLLKVADQVTKVLVEHFYSTILADPEMTVARALQQAMLKTRMALEQGAVADRNGPLPALPELWGAFFVLGDGQANIVGVAPSPAWFGIVPPAAQMPTAGRGRRWWWTGRRRGR